MTIQFGLSASEVADVITKLQQMKDNLEDSVCDFVDTLTINGAIIANAAYDGMANAVSVRDKEDHGLVEGHIGVTGDSDDVVYIAEFGAGDTVMSPNAFENLPPVDVYSGAYSEQVGTREYADTGRWQFPPGSGHYMTFVPPRHGLLNAKEYLTQNADDIARQVIRL